MPAVHAILSDPEVVAHNPSELVERVADVDFLLRHWLGHWNMHGFGNCCLVERSTGEVVGNCGLRHTRVGSLPALNLMYRLTPSRWGRGYASEAAQALLGWAATNLQDEIVVARIRPANLASQRVATGIGLTHDLELDALDSLGADGPEWIFSSRDDEQRR